MRPRLPEPWLRSSTSVAQLSLASGLLAVFAAGLALQKVREQPRPHTQPLPAATGSQSHLYETLATHSHHASATMRDSVQGFNEHLERLAELALVLDVGAMLAYAKPLPVAWGSMAGSPIRRYAGDAHPVDRDSVDRCPRQNGTAADAAIHWVGGAGERQMTEA